MTLPDPPVQSAPCTGRAENTELVRSDVPQSAQQQDEQAAGRQAGSREQRWAGSHHQAGRQAGRARKLKAVV